MRAFFRISMLKQRVKNANIIPTAINYPRLKITHPEVFVVLMDVYSEFGDAQKLQELISLIKT